MLLENIIFGGIFSHIDWTASRRCPVWFLLCLLAYYCPLFPPKKKSDAEKAEIARAELEEFVAEHGQMPSQHAELKSSRSSYWKLQKAKLLHLLKHDWRRGVCDDSLKFYDLHGRIPRRQNVRTDEQRAEDALAQRWDRLLAQKASLPNELLNEYHRMFAAAEMEVDHGHLAVCIAVSEFFETTRRLPKRQVVDSADKQAEDALARRWDRLMAEKASVSEDLLSSYSAIFGAAEMEVDDGHLAVCIAVSEFFETTRRLPVGTEHLRFWDAEDEALPRAARQATVIFRLDTADSTLHSLHFPLVTLHFTLYTPHSTLYTLHSTLYTLQFTVRIYALRFTLHTLHFTLHTLDVTLYIPHFTFYTPRSYI